MSDAWIIRVNGYSILRDGVNISYGIVFVSARHTVFERRIVQLWRMKRIAVIRLYALIRLGQHKNICFCIFDGRENFVDRFSMFESLYVPCCYSHFKSPFLSKYFHSSSAYSDSEISLARPSIALIARLVNSSAVSRHLQV